MISVHSTSFPYIREIICGVVLLGTLCGSPVAQAEDFDDSGVIF